MQVYYGTKRIIATPMSRSEYNELRGWQLPADENGADEGYLVEYTDGGKPNLEGYEGYVSWSPKEQFEKAYQPLNALSFGHAVEAAKAGFKIARAGWNGKGMWLAYIPEDQWGLGSGQPYDSGLIGHGFLPWIGMKTAGGEFVPWLASQTDVLANDWQVID